MWNLMLLLRTKRWNVWCNMKQIAATRHSNAHLWAGSWTLIWSASSWRTATHSNKCSRMQPQSSSHYPPAQENAWSGEYASSKNLHDWQQQSVTWVHRSTADQRAPSALLTGQTPHPHQKAKWSAWNRPCIRFSWTQSFSSSLPVSSLPWLPRKWQAQNNWSKWLAAANQCCLSTPKNELQAMWTYWLLLRELYHAHIISSGTEPWWREKCWSIP